MSEDTLNGLTACFTKAGLTGISGAATTFSTGATALQYAIGGKAYSNAQVSGGTTPTTGAVSGDAMTLTASQARALVFVLDSSGNEKIIEGPVVSLNDADDFDVAPEFPNIDLETYCPFAYVIAKADSTLSGTFTVGSSNWNTSGMSFTVVDVMTLPKRPQTS